MPQGATATVADPATERGMGMSGVRSVNMVAKHGRLPGTRQLVVCAGDSITRGQVSSDWVGTLAGRLAPAGCELVNAGVNGNLAWNVAARLDAVIACSPDVVTLLVGTNDVIATLSPSSEASYRREQRLPERPTLDWYRSNVALILGRLAMETSARVAVIEIPPLGEDPGSLVNARVGRYNDVLHEVADAAGVPVLPLFDRLVDLLPVGHVPPPYTGSRTPILVAAVEHLLLRRPWDRA
ncbi:MAG: GDSL-type esterase/lipase family protein, partial [Chloroflexota bacterium]